MRIWIINNYAVEPKYGGMQRHANFAKFLTQMGHDVTVFAGSHIHQTDIQLINGKEKFQIVEEYPLRWINVKTLTYGKSMKKRVVSMFQFYFNVLKAAKSQEKPDVIIGSSAHPLASVAAIRMGKKFGCMSIAEVRDLWPESIVAYSIAKRTNPIIRLLYKLEKWIYTKADRVIFTMEGGRDYIIERGWDLEHGGSVDLSKVYHINNGVDLEQFDRNAAEQAFADADLDDPDTFKVVYGGSNAKSDGIRILVDVAKILEERGCDKIRLLIFGRGDQQTVLRERIKELGLKNIHIKDAIGKEKVPYMLSRADACLLHWLPTPIVRYGMSLNKTFEYMASAKPLISNNSPKYDVIKKFGCGVSADVKTAEEYAELIEKIYRAPKSEYDTYCQNSRSAAKSFDFASLTKDLLRVIM